MKAMLVGISAALLLGATSGAVWAQICSDYIQASAPEGRFSDNGNGTVSDAATGLMWKQCAEGLSGAGCATGGAEAFPWQQTLQRAMDAEFAGYSDWRLPNKNELASLMEQRCVDPAIDLRVFPNTPSTGFWSSSPGAGSPDYAWFVGFFNGAVSYTYKSYAGPVRLVRGGQ